VFLSSVEKGRSQQLLDPDSEFQTVEFYRLHCSPSFFKLKLLE